MMINSLLLSLMLSCASEEVTDVQYHKAELIPPFEHGNSAWAGVALLDYDSDGWLDIYFPNGQSQADALYRNLGNGQFVDVAQELGLDSLEQHGAVASADLDNDGDPDLVVTKDCSLGTLAEDGRGLADGGVRILWNELSEGGLFREQILEFTGQPQEVGICPVSVELIDFNKDGLLDISVSNGIDFDQIYPWIYRKEVREAIDVIQLNDDDHLFNRSVPIDSSNPAEEENVGTETGLNPDETELLFMTFTSIFYDLNGDGRLDKLAGFSGGGLGVYLQQEDGSLRLRWDKMSDLAGLWMGFAIADFDGNGSLEMYSTNQGLSPLIAGYDNIPKPEVGELIDDNFVQSHVYPFHSIFDLQQFKLAPSNWEFESNNLLVGDLFDGLPDENGTELHPYWNPPENLQRLAWGWGVTIADLDADGWMDVVFNGNNCNAPMSIVGNEEHGAGPGGILHNQKGKGFTDRTWEWGLANLTPEGSYPDGRGVAVGDLNNDGFSDIVFANRNYNPSQSGPMQQVFGSPNVFLSQGHPGNWLQIDLVGTKSNRDGIGSIIRIDDGEEKRFYLFEPGGTTNSSNERLLTIGVGDHRKVTVDVLFPSGRRITEKNVQSNQRIIITEE